MSPDDEVKVARRTAVVIGALAIVGGIFANGQNIAFLVALAFAVAASANLPTILYSLFWKNFTTRGAPVSYTHLDVYKRQLVSLARQVRGRQGRRRALIDGQVGHPRIDG